MTGNPRRGLVATAAMVIGVGCVSPGASPADTSAGRKVFVEKGCLACHRPGATELAALSAYSPAELAAAIRAPPSPTMPVIPMSDADLRAVVAYLRATYP